MTQTLTDHRPDVSNICTDDWEWMEVHQLYHGPSCDFPALGLAEPRNANTKRSHPHFERLMESLRTEGFRRPVLMEEYEGKLALGNGHHRVVAAYDLGYTHIPVTRDLMIGWGDDEELDDDGHWIP